MAEAAAAGRQITFTTSDAQTFKVDEEVAKKFGTVQLMLEEELSDDAVFPLGNVKGSTLAKVLEYCKYHGSPDQQQAAPPKPEADVKRWDAEFIDVDKNTLFDLVLAANYLDIEELLMLAVNAVADKVGVMSDDEVKTYFNAVDNKKE